MIDPDWTVTPPWQGTGIEKAFKSLAQVFQIQGKVITKDELSEVILVELEGTRFYIKRYVGAGKGLRKYLGKSRIKSEWENMLFFHQIGISAANVVGFGEEKKYGFFRRGALITEELKATTDLARLAQKNDPILKKKVWVRSVIQQVASIARQLHDNRFIHTDFKWRNILVTTNDSPQVSLIDCPAGYQWPKGRLFRQILHRGMIKDLACLDKVAKYQLSRTQRLYFYKQYIGQQKLSPKHKQDIQKIVQFFEGRE